MFGIKAELNVRLSFQLCAALPTTSTIIATKNNFISTMYTFRVKNTTMSISLRKLNVGMVHCKDIPRVVDFLMENYFPAEPLSKSLSLIEDQQAIEELRKFCTNLLYQNVSVVATTSEGDVAGVACNAVIRKDQPPVTWENASLTKIENFITNATEKADIFGKHPEFEQYLHVTFLAVSEDDRDLGLVKRLVEYSKEVALKLGLKLMRIDFCNTDCGKVAQKKGWTCLAEIVYNEYKVDDELVFKGEDGNEAFGVYVMKIESAGFLKSFPSPIAPPTPSIAEANPAVPAEAPETEAAPAKE
ncbi:arylalkylamine N-acetyltransferase 1-like [Onthophagus taurus]|uniref:arylalkylamine N-acetyltransferase 1-like n=1 Tax=Onthophagus taurus TaxID=166361 RepID=UPI0039BEAC5C